MKIILYTIEKTPLFQRYYNLVLLAINAGMRRGYLPGLRWRDVDFQRHTVTIAQQVLQESGLPYRNFHCLRHTHATRLLANGIPIIEISRRLSHSSVKQTLDMYSHAIPNYDQEIARKISAIYQ